MKKSIHIIGAGLAGSQAALTLADLGFAVQITEMRPLVQTSVHKTDYCAELVCSNSLKSMDSGSAAGMLKEELAALGSQVFAIAKKHAVPAGGALALNRDDFAKEVTQKVVNHPNITFVRGECVSVGEASDGFDAVILATGPLTSDTLAADLARLTGEEYLAFYDAAAPIVMADSLNCDILFRQSRYEEGAGDYLNAPMNKETYETFITELLGAQRVILKDFESKDLFQACQPIEEVARAGKDAPRFGALKPVGIIDPQTGRRPWANIQLRAENAEGTCYNLVGFQTNLTFGEQKRVFRMIPGLEQAEFARYGVMHKNTFIDAPRLLTDTLRLKAETTVPLYVCGQLSGTEGYVEAIRSGLHCGLSVAAALRDETLPQVPRESAFGALLAYATNPETMDYQPSHVNFGMMPPLDNPPRNKSERRSAMAARGRESALKYAEELRAKGYVSENTPESSC